MTATHDHSDLLTEGQSSKQEVPSSFRRYSEPLTANMTNSKCPTPEKAKPNPAQISSPNSVMSNFESTRQCDHLSVNNQPEIACSNGLLHVQVESSVQNTSFYVPVSLMLQREVDMQKSAQETRTSVDRWSGSRLYCLWNEGTQEQQEGEMTLCLSPEVAMESYSKLEWHPWMTSCIRAYYNSGTIRVPDQCLGSDILMALEYFGILTSNPSTFIVESRQALDRIKAWSAYFAYRNTIADWVVEDYRSRKKANRLWITTPNLHEMKTDETLLQVSGATASVLWGGLEQSMATNGRHSASGQIIHQIFYDNASENQQTREMPSRIRQDFCQHLQRKMAALRFNLSFDIDRVKTTKASGHVTTAPRAVLRIWSTDGKDGGIFFEIRSVKSLESRRSQPGSLKLGSTNHRRKNSLNNFNQHDYGHSTKQHLFREGDTRMVRKNIMYKDTKPGYGSNDIKDFSSTTTAGMPVGFINTAFGDLQSVTSALSDPYFDESTVGGISNRAALPSGLEVRASQKVANSGPSSAKEDDDNAMSSPPPTQKMQDFSEVEVMPSTQEEQSVGISNEAEVKPPECGYWEELLASVCESVAPVAQSNRSISPTKNIIISSSSVEELTAPPGVTSKIAVKQSHEWRREKSTKQESVEGEGTGVGLLAKAEEVVKSATLEGQAAKEWLESTLNDPRTRESAENLGQALSNQFDNILKLALDSEDPRGAVNQREKGIPEVVPLPNFSCSLPMPMGSDGETCFTVNSSEDLPSWGQCSTITPNDTIETPEIAAIGKKVWRKPPVQSLRSLSTGKIKQPLSTMNNNSVGLPPRGPSKARMRQQRIPIARKKGSFSEKSKSKYDRRVEL